MTRRDLLKQIFTDHRTLTGGDLPLEGWLQVRNITDMGELEQLMLDQQTELKLALQSCEA